MKQQSHDLLYFRRIGQEDYELRIAFFILRQPSAQAPNRKHRMQAFSVRQAKTRRVSQFEKDEHLILTAMKRRRSIQKINKWQAYRQAGRTDAGIPYFIT